MQNGATNEVLTWVVVCHRAIDEDGKSSEILKSVDVDSMEIVDTVVSAGIPSCSVIGNISLGEEICSVRGGVDHRSSDNTNVVGDVSTTNVGLEKRGMDLSAV